MKVVAEIKKEVLSRWDEDLYPECNNAEYLDYKKVKAGISEEIVAYGYMLYVKYSKEASIVFWIKKATALAMIEYAGLGVAMENGFDEVKEIADYITLSNEEDGVAHVINKFMIEKVESV